METSKRALVLGITRLPPTLKGQGFGGIMYTGTFIYNTGEGQH